MKISILYILMQLGTALGLKGPLNSICYGEERYQGQISIFPNEFNYEKGIVEQCCQGYKQVNDVCKPFCKKSCGFGICIAPDVCQCDKYYLQPWCTNVMCPAGYKGPNCNEPCSRDTFGPNCETTCLCYNGYCDPKTGRCDCHEGWSGPTCSKCECLNGGICVQLNGHCVCPIGYIGKRCEDICPEGFWGLDCSKTCNCKNNGCNPYTGKCENDCTNGEFVNKECLCDKGWTGELCDKKCECQNGECNRSGDCICEPGWQGKNCEEMCGEGYYGPECAKQCIISVPGNFLCDHIEGVICKPGYNGTQCMDLCSEGTFGRGCAPCSCINASKCNKFTGECECNPGWYGSKCDLSCPGHTYGKDCEHECPCPKCRPTDGFCLCQTGWNGTYCKEYCPLKYFNITTNLCVEVDYTPSFDYDTKTVIIAGTLISVALLASFSIVIVIIVCMKKTKEKRYIPAFPSQSSTHIYEEIPEIYPYDHYNSLDYIPVEEGYLTPNEVVFRQSQIRSSINDNYESVNNMPANASTQ